MSKTTKIIAALGIVAGLGVAALPAFTFAVEPVTGDVEVQVEVQPAIAMTIEGNNDNGNHKAKAFKQETVTVGETDVEGMYEYNAATGEYFITEDTKAEDGKTYFSPDYHQVSNYSPNTLAADTHIGNYVVSGTPVLGTSSSYIAMLPASVVNGAWSDTPSAENNFASKITVYTNNTSGYTLAVADKDSDTDLDRLDGQANIPTGTPAQEATTFDLAAGTAAWGYKVNPQTTASTGYSPMVPSTSAATIKADGAAVSAGETTIVTYGVATGNAQATGIYADTIVYTATCI